jgi:hypothetical protein
MDWAHTVSNHGAVSLVVIDNFNISGAGLRPYKADPPLIVNPDAALADSVALQLFQPVARW